MIISAALDLHTQPLHHHPQPMDARYSIGGAEVGVIIATLLFGVCTVQVYFYFVALRRDVLWIRLLVASIWALDCLTTLFMWLRLYHITVQQFGNRAVEESPQWMLYGALIMAGLVEASAQGFFAYRIHVLSQRWPLTILLWAGSVAIVITQTVTVALHPNALISMSQNHVWLVTGTQAVVAFVDCISTVALCSYLRIRKTGFSGTDHVINRFFIWTLQTGLITTVAALTSFILSLSLSNPAVWICIEAFQSKLYSNSLLASLNGRDTLREGMGGSQEMGLIQSQSTRDYRSLSARIMSGEASAIALSAMDSPNERPDSEGISKACV